MQFTQYLANLEQTLTFGHKLAKAMPPSMIVYLSGNLGAGKTALVRGCLQAFGHEGAVKSPTYTLVEPYELPEQQVYHFDLYRLGDSEELEYVGIRDYTDSRAICFFEWPEKGLGCLPEPDLDITLEIKDSGRQVNILANTPEGKRVIQELTDTIE